MEPKHNNNYESLTELPTPENAGSLMVPEQNKPASPETRGAQPTQNSATSQQPLVIASDVPGSDQPVIPSTTDNTQTSGHASSTMIADDTDLIEKEWVVRAKAIVMQTRDDPYKQNTEMNKVKADYLKKRYDKDLKVNP